MTSKNKIGYEMPHYTEHELYSMNRDFIVWAYCLLQDKFERLRDKDYPDLEERHRIMTIKMFGRSSEKERILNGSDHSEEKDEPGQQNPETLNSSSGQTDDTQDADTDNNKESGGKKHPVRTKGCADKVTKDLPILDEDIELTPDELENIFGVGVNYVDDPKFEKTYDEVCALPCNHYVVRYHIHVYRGDGKIVPAGHVEKMKKGSIVSESLLAEIVDDRCVMQLPMNRVSQKMAREGLHLTRQTMARWCIDIGSKYVGPLVFRMLDLIVNTGYVQVDETSMIIGRTLDKRRQEARQWVFRTSTLATDNQIIVFYFDETRSTDVLRELLGSIKKQIKLICDSYISYKTFSNEMKDLVILAHCLTHARRNFTDIIKVIPGFKKMTEKEKMRSLAYRIVKMIDKIFEKERIFKNMKAAERLSHRQVECTPIVNEIYDTIKNIPKTDFDKSSKLYEAVNYLIDQEENFRVFLNDGNVPVHNSSCEQAIIPFALGRNGWKSIDSIDGGITLGYFYSLTETAKANGAVPFYYLQFLFERLPKLFKEANGRPSPESFDELMPWTDLYKSCEAKAIESNREVLIQIRKLNRSKTSE